MYQWTLPLINERADAYLVLPRRFITEEEYGLIMKIMEIFKPGLIAPEPDEDEACEWGRMSLLLLEADSPSS